MNTSGVATTAPGLEPAASSVPHFRGRTGFWLTHPVAPHSVRSDLAEAAAGGMVGGVGADDEVGPLTES